MTATPALNDAWQRLEPFLQPGERLRWAGRPDPKVHFTKADIYLVPFSLLWGGFAMVWETLAITGDSPAHFALWGIPFVLMGLYFIFGRFIYKRRRKLTTVYGLTDSRAIVSVTERSVTDAPVKGASVQTDRSRDGRHATVIFGGNGKPAPYQNTGMDFFTIGSAQTVGFFDVADPDALIRELNSVRR